MAQKFGNGRWIQGGFLDNRTSGCVVGQLRLAGLGTVDVCLRGNFSGEIEGKLIQFLNPRFIDDPRAGESLEEFDIPQLGTVSLISFDPHPLLSPHPYVEWFSLQKQHYRIELEPDEAWIVADKDLGNLEQASRRIYQELSSLLPTRDA